MGKKTTPNPKLLTACPDKPDFSQIMFLSPLPCYDSEVSVSRRYPEGEPVLTLQGPQSTSICCKRHELPKGPESLQPYHIPAPQLPLSFLHPVNSQPKQKKGRMETIIADVRVTQCAVNSPPYFTFALLASPSNSPVSAQPPCTGPSRRRGP